jgi:hypothetical protein
MIAKEMEYDGSQINPYWARNSLGLEGDSIVAFRGECNVKPEHMVDLEDKARGEKIYSPDMLHFIAEHFDSSSMKLAYARQRLLVCIAQEGLCERGRCCSRRGDDLFYDGKKLSVAIASASEVSQKIHFGINVKSEEYMSLEKMGITDVDEFMKEICQRYCHEIEEMERDLRKSKPLEVSK